MENIRAYSGKCPFVYSIYQTKPGVLGSVLSLLYFYFNDYHAGNHISSLQELQSEERVLKFISQTTHRNINKESFSPGSDKRMSPLRSQVLQSFSSWDALSP